MAKFDLLLQTILNTLTIAEAMKKLRGKQQIAETASTFLTDNQSFLSIVHLLSAALALT